jgi:hypothetical protein
MKKTAVLPVFVALGFSVCLIAQSEADYSGWMKDIAQTKGKVTKGVASKSADVAGDADHLAGLFGMVVGFWQAKNVDGAVGIAKKAEKASKEIASAARANDEAKEQSALMELTGACGACHMQYRGGSPGNFTIKQ